MSIDADIADDFSAMGAGCPAGTITDPDEDAFEVWSVNWDSLTAFLACETQWRAAATMAGLFWLGLDYAAVDVVLRRLAAPDAVFADLRVMERAALAAFAEAR